MNNYHEYKRNKYNYMELLQKTFDEQIGGRYSSSNNIHKSRKRNHNRNIINKESYYDQETKLNKFLANEMPLYIKLNNTENNRLINYIARVLARLQTDDNLITNKLVIESVDELRNIFQKLNFKQLIYIYNSEELSFLKENTKLVINNKKLNEYIRVKNMNVAYSIYSNNKSYNLHESNIYPMHSLGKVFTGILLILLIHNDIIDEDDLNKPLQLPKNIYDKLPESVRNRLQETTMLDVMTHQSGLKNYLGKYLKSLETNDRPNPTEPEDFVKYIDDDVNNDVNDDVNEKNVRIYSNAGLLLCGISALHLYNTKTGENKHYNELLNEYIILPAKLSSFYVSKPNDAVYNINHKTYEYVSGSPAGGYWISCLDLCKFGRFCLKLTKNQRIFSLIKKYGGEFYNNNVINHTGALRDTSCILRIDIIKNTVISIMDIDGVSTTMILNALRFMK